MTTGAADIWEDAFQEAKGIRVCGPKRGRFTLREEHHMRRSKSEVYLHFVWATYGR